MSQESLLALKPDFVLEVFQTIDGATGKPTTEASTDLKKLLTVLDSKNFSIEIRPGTVKTLLVFVKLGKADLIKSIEDDKINDWIYGVNNDVLNSTLVVETLTIAEKLRIINQVLTAPSELGGCGITPTVGDWNFVRSIVPVSNQVLLKAKFSETKSESTAFNDAANEANIQFILENFGARYAFYHYFINSYITALLPLAVVGFLTHFIFLRYSLVFTAINITWAIAFYLYWKFTQLKLSKKWGVSKNIEELEIPKSAKNLDEPQYKRLLRELSFIPTSLVFVGWLIGCQFFCFTVEIFLNEVYDGWLKPYLSLVPTILLSLMVPVVTMFYDKFATRSLEWETHSKNSTFNYSKVIKTFVFNFLTSYMALFITSFFYLPFGFKLNGYLPTVETRLNSYVNISVKRDNFAINKWRLDTQYQFFILTNQVVGLVLEFVLPTLMAKVLAHPTVKSLMGQKDDLVMEYNDSEAEKEYLEDVRSMLQLPEYNVDDDFRQLVLQFGFLVLFGPVWSLGPLISLVINLIQQKMDFVKVFKLVKTPVPSRSNSIFPWDDFLKFLIWLGSLSSVAIAVMYHGDIVSSSSRSAVGIRWWKIVGPALVVEHLAVLALRAGEKVIDYYVDYLEKQEENVEGEVDVRKKYLDTVYERQVVTGGEGKSFNNIPSLLQISTLIPHQLIKAKAVPSVIEKKTSIEKDLNKVDAKIEKASKEKQDLDKLYEEKNNQVKATESSHVKKLDELAGASAIVDEHSKGLIQEKSQILNQLDAETSSKLEQLEQLKEQKQKLEQLKKEKAGNLYPQGASKSSNGAAIAGVPTTNSQNGEQIPLTEKLKQYVPESVATTAATAVAGATAAATTVAATAQSKIVDLQGKQSNGVNGAVPYEDGEVAKGYANGNNFDLQEGDRVITSKAHMNGNEVRPVVATIDNNEHFQPDEDLEVVDGGEYDANTTLDSAADSTVDSTTDSDVLKTPSKGPKLKKSKSPLKSLFKKKLNGN